MTVPADLASLPKAELHVHLEGTVRPATAEEFCAREGVSVTRTFAGLDNFVDAYDALWRTMTRPGDYARIVREYCDDAVRHGISYAEIEFAPIGRQYNHVAEAIEAAGQQRDIVVRFSVGNVRSFPVEVAWAMLKAVADLPEFVAFGLGGREHRFPPELFHDVFAEARRRGLRSAPHAGEAAGPESVRGALDALSADRIQHGVRAVEDPALVAELAERRVPLAICPTSNLRLGVVDSLDEHPLRELWDAGVLLSVNTDDPGFFDCDLLGEYAIAGQLLGLDRAGYGRLARNSIDGSFAPDDVKHRLRSEIDDWVQRD